MPSSTHTPHTVQVSLHRASLFLTLRTVLAAEPLWALQTWLGVLEGLGEVSLSSALQGKPSSDCRWSEEEFLHRQTEGQGEERGWGRGRTMCQTLPHFILKRMYFFHLAHEAIKTERLRNLLAGNSRTCDQRESRKGRVDSPVATETFKDSSPGGSCRPGKMVRRTWQEACTSWDRPEPSFPAGHRGRWLGMPSETCRHSRHAGTPEMHV